MAFTFLMGAKFLAAVATGSSTTMVVDKGLDGQLLRLDPQTRLEQTCDTEILRQINREKAFNVDKVIAYTFGDPIIRDNRIKAPGAVLRSDGEWYHLSFQCVTGSRHLNAKSTSYKIGSKIPRSQWSALYLYD